MFLWFSQFQSFHSFFLRTTLMLAMFFFEMAKSVSRRDQEVLYTTWHTDISERLTQQSSDEYKALCFTSKSN